MASSQPTSVTVVSACDRNFFWGLYLLAASMARHIPQVPLVASVTGFTPEDKQWLEMFPSVQVRDLREGEARSVANRKAEALLSPTETDYVAWLDADCLVIGDIAPLLIPDNGEFQIRLREPWENGWVWRKHYAAGEVSGLLPASVKQRWQADVGELQTPCHDTTCVTNTFVLHRRHLPFIERWQQLIARVIPAQDRGVVDPALHAYFMIDESVFSALLAYAEAAPAVSPLRLNRDPQAHVAHFGANPKPWKRWRWSQWYCHRHVMETLAWVKASGRTLPPLPWSLQARYTLPALAWALLEHVRLEGRAQLGKWLRPGGGVRRRLSP